MGLSQVELATQVGLTFQQVQKYEKGINRISVSRLIEMSAVLGCQPKDFLVGLSNGRIVDIKRMSDDAMRVARRYDELSDKLRPIVVATLRAVEGLNPGPQ